MNVIQLFATTIISALTATIVCIIGYYIAKTRLYAQTVTVQRINWATEMRGLLFQFVDVYIDGKDLNKAKSIRAKIGLYLNTIYPDHIRLAATLNDYVASFGKDCDLTALTGAAQTIFGNSWRRVKWESGFKDSQERRIRRMLYGKKHSKKCDYKKPR